MVRRKYDLFAGALEAEPVWLESFDDLTHACTRMRERAQTLAGRYFVYCPEIDKMFAVIDTRPSKDVHTEPGPISHGRQAS